MRLVGEPVVKSILTYPGSKRRAISVILPIFPKDISSIVSTFCGGASIELYLASCGHDVITSDIDRSVINFWNWMKKDRHALAEHLYKFIGMSNLDIYRIIGDKDECDLNGAANRYVRSVIRYGGAYGSGLNKKKILTQSMIHRLKNTPIPKNIKFKVSSWEKALRRKASFYYLDPPYVNVDDRHYIQDIDHEKLSNILSNFGGRFALSYNDSEVVRKLYKWAKIHEIKFLYSIQHSKVTELLITNY